eukprot:CAMPEP_0202492858 /NCGR_PEP_ID=MMETSP1361-20130828/9411_1 /ASSEMBLY_ACC=CAM_ASM_000849 /TAXON_ID=210615 /ORGANISM="Staurosira complex sp., Strain CCMP2646" /LENGTH=58 /DNA_ID=CAMNT_0049123099 /DNA_START=1268 /DNA_END=1441 /DNA_ORIENTATION=-
MKLSHHELIKASPAFDSTCPPNSEERGEGGSVMTVSPSKSAFLRKLGMAKHVLVLSPL